MKEFYETHDSVEVHITNDDYDDSICVDAY